MRTDMRMEEFSKAYVRAVAAVAGFAVEERGIDRDSVDVEFCAAPEDSLPTSPQLAAQLKSTTEAHPERPDIRYELKLKNYDELRVGKVMVPRVLILVLMHADDRDWIHQTEEELAVRKCGYWASLRNHPDSGNSRTVTVGIPRCQVFSPGALTGIMTRIDSGGLP